MNRYVSGILVLFALAGCATKQEWRLVDGAWVGPHTTYQKGSEPRLLDICPDPSAYWACNVNSYGGFHR